MRILSAWRGDGDCRRCHPCLCLIAYGSTVISLADVVSALGRALGMAGGEIGPVDRIVTDLRLPRAILAIASGAGLGVVGLLLQTVTRNDLADPFLFGLSAGSPAGAVAVITASATVSASSRCPLAAFAAVCAPPWVVLLLIRRTQGYGRND